MCRSQERLQGDECRGKTTVKSAIFNHESEIFAWQAAFPSVIIQVVKMTVRDRAAPTRRVREAAYGSACSPITRG
jgi:hypothetical protein